MSSHLRHPDSLDLSFHTPALKLIRQLRIIGVDTENIPGLCFFNSLKKCVEGRFELASNARTRSTGETQEDCSHLPLSSAPQHLCLR